MPVIRISDSLYKKLESLAKGFDTPQNVIERLVGEVEGIDMKQEKIRQGNKITLDIIKQIYPLAKDVFDQKLDVSRAQDILVKDTGMNPGSAKCYLQTFQKIMDGECYKITINGPATEYFFEMIHADFGQQALIKALSSVEKHIEYYEGLGKGKLQNIRKILHKFSERS